jgi:hypothetical protein
MPTALKSAHLTLPEPPWKVPLESKRRACPRVKAPFVLTAMYNSFERPLLWLWSRRGRAWVITQKIGH